MAETTQPLTVVGRTGRPIAIHAHLKLLTDLLLISIPQQVNLNDLAPGDCLHDLSHGELTASLATLLPNLHVAHTLQFTAPYSLNFDDPV